MDALAKAYFDKFIVRVEILREFEKRKAYSDVIREGQEALELFIRGLLRSAGVEPSHSHDPGKELGAVASELPLKFQELLDDIVSWSKRLRKERELSFYGASDFIPTQEYSAKDAREVIEFEEKMSKLYRRVMK